MEYLLWIISLSLILVLIFKKPRNFPPGPISLPFIGGLYKLQSNPFYDSLRLHKKYGPIVGIDLGPERSVIIKDAQLIKNAFINPDIKSRPDLINCRSKFRLKNKKVAGLLNSDGSVYDENAEIARKLLKEYGYGTKKLESIILTQIIGLFRIFDSSTDIFLTSTNFFNTYSAKVTWSILSKRRMPSDKKIKESIEYFDKIKKASAVIRPLSMLHPWLRKFASSEKKTGWLSYVANWTKFSQIFEDAISDHKIRNWSLSITGDKDFIDQCLDELNQPTNSNSVFAGEFGEFNLSALLSDLILGGVDTVAEVMTWSFLCLINFPEVQDELHVQIDKAIPEEYKGLITLGHKPRLPHVDAFIMEVMRFRHPVPWGVPHMTTKSTKIGKYDIPKGTAVYANLFALFQDRKLWTDPDEFRFGRFLNEKNEVIQFDWFIPFSAGLRACPGQFVAREEIFLMTANILRHFNVKGEPWHPMPDMTPQMTFMFSPKAFEFTAERRKSGQKVSP